MVQNELCECRGGRPGGFCGRKATLHHHKKRTYASLQASVAVKQNVYLLSIVLTAQEVCGNPGVWKSRCVEIQVALPSIISIQFSWTSSNTQPTILSVSRFDLAVKPVLNWANVSSRS